MDDAKVLILEATNCGKQLIAVLGSLKRNNDDLHQLDLIHQTQSRVSFVLRSIQDNRVILNSSYFPSYILGLPATVFKETSALLNGASTSDLVSFQNLVYITSERLVQLEQQLDAFGLLGSHRMLLKRRDELVECVIPSDDKLPARTSKVPKSCDATDSNQDERTIFPQKTRSLMHRLSRDSLSDSSKEELCLQLLSLDRESWQLKKGRLENESVWKGCLGVDTETVIGLGSNCRVNPGRLNLSHKTSRFSHKYTMKVAVKSLKAVRPTRKILRQKFPSFIRELYLQMEARNPYVLRTYGAFWPKESKNQAMKEPFIVSELMSDNLRGALEAGMLNSWEMKKRILTDVSVAIAHLHSRRIVHRDIKLENVLVRIIDGNIVGPAKIANFGLSRIKVEEELMSETTDETRSSDIGTYAYMAPELCGQLYQSRKDDSNGHRFSLDVWSFGVLICVVCIPDCLSKADVGRKFHAHAVLTKSGSLQNKFIELASQIENGLLRQVAKKCLVWKPDKRPEMRSIVHILNSRGSEEQLEDETDGQVLDTAVIAADLAATSQEFSHSKTGTSYTVKSEPSIENSSNQSMNDFEDEDSSSSNLVKVKNKKNRKEVVKVEKGHALFALRKHKHVSPITRGTSCNGYKTIAKGTFITLSPINLIDPASEGIVHAKNDYIVEESKFYDGADQHPKWDDPGRGVSKVGEWFAFCHNQEKRAKGGFVEFFQIIDKRPASERPSHWIMPGHKNRRVIVLSRYIGYATLRATLLALGLRSDDDKRNCLLGTVRRDFRTSLTISLE